MLRSPVCIVASAVLCFYVHGVSAAPFSSAAMPQSADWNAEAYADEWLTLSTPGLCPGNQLQSGVSYRGNVFNSTRVHSAAGCCRFCHEQVSLRSAVWTFHEQTKLCMAADALSEPVSNRGALSGFLDRNVARKQPTRELPEPNPPLGFKPSFVGWLLNRFSRFRGDCVSPYCSGA